MACEDGTRAGVHPIDGEGTPEHLWRDWNAWVRLPVLDLGGVSRAVVVAPHPDDETLGFGGGLARLVELGTEVTVVAVTDGEGSHPASTALTREALVAARAAERAHALACLGAQGVEVVRLGLPDGAVASHEEELSARLAALCTGADLCVASWEGDLHPDHEATGRAARRAVRGRGAVLLSYPVWMWHWARPGEGTVPWSRAHRIDLAPRVRSGKDRALGGFATQVAPVGAQPGDRAVLSPEMLAHFSRDCEVVFR